MGGFGYMRLLELALAVSAAFLLGLLVLPGDSDAQETPPPFLANEGPPPPGANVPCERTDEHP